MAENWIPEAGDIRSRKGRHYNERERHHIEVMIKAGYSVARMAEALGRPRLSIYREIGRNKDIVWDHNKGREKEIYWAESAQRKANNRQQLKGSDLKIGNDHQLAESLCEIIKKDDYSPYAALQKLKGKGYGSARLPCEKTIYNYIHAGVIYGLTMDDLPMRGKRKAADKKQYAHKHTHVRGRSIEERSDKVKDRVEFGHWEGDTVVGKKGTRSVVFTFIERKTRFYIGRRKPNRKKPRCVEILDQLEWEYGKNYFKVFLTATMDNGSEFADWEAMECSRYKNRRKKGERTKVYFAHPYCASERGSNENANGLLRRRLPKGTNLGVYSDAEIRAAIDWVNDYPREILGGKSARQAFHEEMAALGIDWRGG
jgi:IS30 family transposase